MSEESISIVRYGKVLFEVDEKSQKAIEELQADDCLDFDACWMALLSRRNDLPKKYFTISTPTGNPMTTAAPSKADLGGNHIAEFNEHTTELHQAIEDPSERSEMMDLAMIQDALGGSRGGDQQRIAAEVLRWGALMLRKNSDYGSSAWKVPALAPECDPGVAIRVRMSDKLSRLQSLLEKGTAEVEESIDDTLRDLGAYCLLELARPGRQPKEVRADA